LKNRAAGKGYRQKESEVRGGKIKKYRRVNFLLKIYYMFKKYCRHTRLIDTKHPSLSPLLLF
jgi:hypothetical protein